MAKPMKKASKGNPNAANPKSVYMGSGIANRGRSAVVNRARNIDDAVEAAQGRGSLERARRPRSY